jgi:ketosteroid isomerase-like protein
MKNALLKSGLLLVALMMLAKTAVSQTDEKIKAKIEKINKEMAQAMQEGNIEKTLALYTDDAISMPNYEKMSVGKEAIKKSNEEMNKSGVKVISFDPKTLQVKSCGMMITEIGTYKLVLSVPGMEGTTEVVGKYLVIWEQQSDGSLKIKNEIWNSDSNPLEHKQQ